jgi:hypothetical protein
MLPAVARAQEPPALPPWDVAGFAGVFNGHTAPADGPGYRDDWFHAVQTGIVLGRHLTRHVKLELEAAATNGGEWLRERQITIPGYPFPYPIGSEVTTSVRSAGAALTWQFRDNEWVHPFLQAGVSVDFDREQTRTWEQSFIPDPRSGVLPRVPLVEASFEDETTRHVRGLVGGGAKLYVSERAFVRTDGRWSFGDERQNLALRLGFGVDF